MLQKLLNDIYTNGMSNTVVLAARLQISTAMVEAMLDRLVHMGFLQEVTTCSQTHCTGCSMADLCKPVNTKKGRMWMVKEQK